MAGTLLVFDPATGRSGALPGAERILPLLGKDFRQVVTTGDATDSARETLRDHALLDHFEAVFGGLGGPVGKPYGAVLGRLGVAPERSLAIGDRLRADIASDTDRVVSLLVNQGRDRVDAAAIGAVIARLGRDDVPGAFDALLDAGRPLPADDDDGVVRAAGIDGDRPLTLQIFRHPALAGDRRVIVMRPAEEP
ncbi:MAG TPA: hypothetical protein PLQ13_04405 [Candidatus Krumholzibacteria bacterium]|nr:hypothetical protein [Candidatus Krumholzibacteria bacterium]